MAVGFPNQNEVGGSSPGKVYAVASRASLRSVVEEVERWESIYRRARELEKQELRLKDGIFGKLLGEEREERRRADLSER